MRRCNVSDYSGDEIKAQLERILANPEIVAKAKLRRFLTYVIDQKLDGNTTRINQYTIAIEALDYGNDFDPMTNPTVRILAGRLRRALDQYYA